MSWLGILLAWAMFLHSGGSLNDRTDRVAFYVMIGPDAHWSKLGYCKYSECDKIGSMIIHSRAVHMVSGGGDFVPESWVFGYHHQAMVGPYFSGGGKPFTRTNTFTGRFDGRSLAIHPDGYQIGRPSTDSDIVVTLPEGEIHLWMKGGGK